MMNVFWIWVKSSELLQTCDYKKLHIVYDGSGWIASCDHEPLDQELYTLMVHLKIKNL